MSDNTGGWYYAYNVVTCSNDTSASHWWCFFFSSRRRHTSWNCDWSSDVCSSDLKNPAAPRGARADLSRSRRRERATRGALGRAPRRRHALAPPNRVAALHRPADRSASPHGVPCPRRADAGSHSRACHHRAQSRRTERNPMKIRILAVALLVAPAFALAQAEPKDSAKPAAKPAAKAGAVATVNGVAVPRSRLDLMMQQQAARGAPDNDQTRAMVRDELVNREIVAQEAQRAGMAKTSEVQTQLDLARQEVLVSAYIRDWVRKHPITDDDVQKEYDRARSQTGDKEYKARHILVETEDQAKGMIAELKKGGKFDELATKNSKDNGTKDRGGDLDWNVPSVFDPQFADVMVKLEKGKYTETPVRTRYGFHVVQLDDVRQVKFPALAEVRPRIQQQLVQSKVEELVRGLRAKAKVE